jgi:hypothetical protein
MKHTKSSRRTLRVPVSLIGQVFLAISVAQARNDAPPSSDKAWLPPKLSDYENQLAGQRFHEAETGLRVSINPRKTYNLAELIDIAQRSNPANTCCLGARPAGRGCGRPNGERLLPVPRRRCGGRIRPGLYSVSNVTR